jgi:hypothetical protein
VRAWIRAGLANLARFAAVCAAGLALALALMLMSGQIR